MKTTVAFEVVVTYPTRKVWLVARASTTFGALALAQAQADPGFDSMRIGARFHEVPDDASHVSSVHERAA